MTFVVVHPRILAWPPKLLTPPMWVHAFLVHDDVLALVVLHELLDDVRDEEKLLVGLGLHLVVLRLQALTLLLLEMYLAV